MRDYAKIWNDTISLDSASPNPIRQGEVYMHLAIGVTPNGPFRVRPGKATCFAGGFFTAQAWVEDDSCCRLVEPTHRRAHLPRKPICTL